MCIRTQQEAAEAAYLWVIPGSAVHRDRVVAFSELQSALRQTCRRLKRMHLTTDAATALQNMLTAACLNQRRPLQRSGTAAVTIRLQLEAGCRAYPQKRPVRGLRCAAHASWKPSRLSEAASSPCSARTHCVSEHA
jgi:hypothetical protein